MLRPVLSMSFYMPNTENCHCPFNAMVARALKQKKQQQQARQNAIQTAYDGLKQVVEHFFPEKPQETKPIPQHRPHSGPYTYNKDYFQHLQNNLKQINAHLEQLERQV